MEKRTHRQKLILRTMNVRLHGGDAGSEAGASPAGWLLQWPPDACPGRKLGTGLGRGACCPHSRPQFPGCDSCFAVSVTTISRTTGWPSAINDRWLLGNFVRSDNSILCIAVSMRRREYPRTNTSCMAKTSRRICSLPSRLSSAKAKSSCGSSNDCSGDISMRTAHA